MKSSKPDVLEQLAAIGVYLVIRDGRIKARGETSRLTPEHHALVRENRQAIRVWLTHRADRAAYSDNVVPMWPGTAPDDAAWAVYFDLFPTELERLTSDVTEGVRVQRPESTRTTARHWARWFNAHPDEFARALAAAQSRREFSPAEHQAESSRRF